MARKILIITPTAAFETPESELLQGMLTAQDNGGGPVTWTTVSQNIAMGYFSEEPSNRVAVADTELADGFDVIVTTMWVIGATEEQPVIG